MTAAPAPVREPAWSLPRSAIGLWTTEGLVNALVVVLVVQNALLVERAG